MIYTPMTKKAIKLMYDAHKDQVDKAGIPYVFHPFHVAEQMTNESATVVALLHDVIEDTNLTIENLEELGYSNEVIEALKLLTHKEEDEYLEYVKKIAANPIASEVKKADLKHNMTLERLDYISKADLERIKKYKKAYDILNSAEKKHEGLEMAAVIGFAVGDALGVPVEFLPRRFLDLNPVEDMREYGTHNVPKGTWSDDTSLMIATFDSIADTESIDYNNIMNNFLNWFKKGEYTATDEVFDIGNSTRKSLEKFKNGIPALKCGMGMWNDNGNGSLMRILPAVFYSIYNKLNFVEEKELIDNLSSLTHSHEISKLGCKIYSDYLKNIISGKNKIISLKELPLLEYAKYYSPETINLYSNILNGQISSLDRKEIKSTGYVVDTLEASIWAIVHSNSFEEAVLLAVNLGDDTDTIGAITGSMAGVIYGYDNIPEKWINSLKKLDFLEQIVKKFKTKVSASDSLNISDNLISEYSEKKHFK